VPPRRNRPRRGRPDPDRHERRKLKTLTCRECGRGFTHVPGKGRPPVRCEPCRRAPKRSDVKRQARARQYAVEDERSDAPPSGIELAPPEVDVLESVDAAQFVAVLRGRLRAIDWERAVLQDLLRVYEGWP